MRVRTIELKKVIFDSEEEIVKVWDLIKDTEEIRDIREDYTFFNIDNAKQELEFLLEHLGFENPQITEDLGTQQGAGASFTADYFYIDKDNEIELHKLKEYYPQYISIIDSFKRLLDETKETQVEAYYDPNDFRNHYLHSKTLGWHIIKDCEFSIKKDGHIEYEESILNNMESEVERILSNIYFKSMSDEEAFKEGLVENEVEFSLTEEMEKALSATNKETNEKGNEMRMYVLVARKGEEEKVELFTESSFANDRKSTLEKEGYAVNYNVVEPNQSIIEKKKYKVVLPVSYTASVSENLFKYFDDKEEAEKWISDIKENKIEPNDLYGYWEVEGTEIDDDGMSDTIPENDLAQLITL